MYGTVNCDLAVATNASLHGTAEYYLAVATVIPLLLLGYFLNVNVADAISQFTDNGTKRAWVFWIAFLAGPSLALVGGLMGEIVSLKALFEREWTGATASCSVWGLSLLSTAGVIHLCITASNRVAVLMKREGLSRSCPTNLMRFRRNARQHSNEVPQYQQWPPSGSVLPRLPAARMTIADCCV